MLLREDAAASRRYVMPLFQPRYAPCCHDMLMRAAAVFRYLLCAMLHLRLLPRAMRHIAAMIFRGYLF